MEKFCDRLFKRIQSRYDAIILKESEFREDILVEIKSLIQAIDENTKKLEYVYIPDILYIDREGSFALIVTESSKYKAYMTFDMVKDVIRDFKFEISDNKILVNMKKVTFFDSEGGKVYFTEDISGKNGLFTYLSTRNAPKFKIQIGKEFDLSDTSYAKKEKAGKKTLFGFI